MTTLREAAEAVMEQLKGGFVAESDPVAQDLKAALAEEALQRLTDVQQEMERNFCPRCGKRTNDIHTCTPPHEEHFCDTHCTWADHAPGCVRAEPVQEPVAWLTPRTVDSYMRPDLGYETCSKTDYAAFPVYTAPPQRKPRHVSYVCPQCHWSLDERKPLTDEEIEKATREVWRNLPSDFEYTTSSWVEIGIRYAERAHGIGGSNG